jgi:DNA repair photolyase
MPEREPSTRYIEIACKSLLNRVRGMPFEWSINPYRGCAHRCVFCYARRTHEFLDRNGLSDWGTTIFVKANAPQVLRAELSDPKWRGEHVALGTATDPYQAAEGRYRITRAILRELARARTPAHLITRSPLVTRDIDVLQELARTAGVSVCFSLPTLDPDLARRIEPTVAPPAQRLRALRELSAAGIRAGVAIAPVLPFLCDSVAQLRAVYEAAAEAGATFAWHGVLNLGEVARDSYQAFLAEHHPEIAPAYAELYRGKYASAAYVAAVERRARSARSGIRFEPPEGIATEPELQLSLL